MKLAFYPAFLIQKVEDAQLGLNEINAWLVVREVDECPRDGFFHVLLLLQFEDMLEGEAAQNDLYAHFAVKMTWSAGKDTYQVELLLKLLVRIVDAKLFKAVDIKCLEPGGKSMFTLTHVWSSREDHLKTHSPAGEHIPVNVQHTNE